MTGSLSPKHYASVARERLKRSTAIRRLLVPYMNRRMTQADARYEQSADAEYLMSLKDAHKGERCFIVGNGPSLTTDDLDAIRGEWSFASNGIYHVFDKTEWRPDYFVCVDRNALTLELDNILQLGLKRMFIDVFAEHRAKDRSENVTFINQHLTKFLPDKYSTANIGFSEQPVPYLCAGYTVTYAAMQLALFMGFTEIYLLGIDHSYANEVDSKGRIVKKYENEDHFYKVRELRGFYYYEGVECAYELAKRAAEAKGSRIMNATRGGNLEIFERVELDNVLWVKL